MNWGKSEKRKARKPHYCEFCFTTIQPGTVYAAERGVHEGSWWRQNFHIPCEKAIAEQDDPYDDWYNISEIGFPDVLKDFDKAGVLNEALEYLPIQEDDRSAWEYLLELESLDPKWRELARERLATIEATELISEGMA